MTTADVSRDPGSHRQLWHGNWNNAMALKLCSRSELGMAPMASPRSFAWGTDSWALGMGTQPYLTPKFSFSSDFDRFIVKMLEIAKL